MIFLIQPPHTPDYENDLAGVQHTITPPLGLGTLAAMLKRERSYEVRCFDFFLVRPWREEDLIRELAAHRPRMVGLSCTTEQFGQAETVAKLIRTHSPGTALVVGGPHASAAPLDFLPLFDVVVRFDGEDAIVELADYFVEGRGSLDQILGIVYMRDGVPQMTPKRPLERNIDRFPWADRDAFKVAEYRRFNPYACIITGRGCPSRCIFCSAKYMGQDKVRFRSVDDVIAEMRDIHERFGYSEFNIADDTFTCNKRRVEEFCKKVPAEFTWFCESKANELSEGLVQMMKEAGCSSIQIGVETGSDRIQATIGKGINTAMVRNVARWCFDCGMILCGGVMFPFPEDDEESARETMAFIDEVGEAYNMLFFIASTLPFPGTYLGQHHAELGFEVHDPDYRRWSFTRCNVSNRHLDLEQVKRLQAEIAEVVKNNTLAIRRRLAEYETRLRYRPRSDRLTWGRTSAIEGHQSPQDQTAELKAHRAMWRSHETTDFDTISSVQGRITDRIGRTPGAKRRLMVID